MTEDWITALITALNQKATMGTEFRSPMAAITRPDATAWCILALQASGTKSADLAPLRGRLMAAQQPDGQVSISPQHPEAWWPTPLAILAWHQDPEFRAAQVQAIQFLLKTTGEHSPKQNDAPFAHDPSLRGWPWIEGTHSWIIPSSMAVIALRIAGYADHARVREAIRLLLDRQLSFGGWNYGNTKVFDQELQPMVDNTGVALSALANSIPRPEIEPSLRYLIKNVGKIQTPLSLSWGLLGLRAWGETPAEGASWLETCWRRREHYGGYDIVAIALMTLALILPKGIESLFELP